MMSEAESKQEVSSQENGGVGENKAMTQPKVERFKFPDVFQPNLVQPSVSDVEHVASFRDCFEKTSGSKLRHLQGKYYCN